MVKHGGYDPEKQNDLLEGIAAAKSILARADEAVQKEHHAAAVNELQSRVEDWRGHRINHFGELLHFGNYTVLKGEGTKVVEREVSVIFDSLDPVTRAMVFSLFMHSLHRGFQKPPCPQTWMSALKVLNRNPRGNSLSDFASMSGDLAEEQCPVPVTPKAPSRLSLFALRNKKNPVTAQIHSPKSSQKPLERPSWKPFRLKFKGRRDPSCDTTVTSSPRSISSVAIPEESKTPEERAMKIFQDALEALKIGTGLNCASPTGMSRALTSEPSTDNAYLRLMDWSPNAPFRTKPSKGCPSKSLTPLRFLLLKAIIQAEHLYKPEGVFKNTTLFLFSPLQLPSPILSPAISVTAVKAAPIRETMPISDLERQVADDLAIDSFVREQYKVYLFERILLCCKEVNPNKSKNKMLATKQPLVDKKGKPKLQLKGRIFMQNVTDVVTLSKHSTKDSVFVEITTSDFT